MKQIAEVCGVSVMTVSRVLNNRRYVRPEVRSKVEAALKEFNYTPDPALNALIHYRNESRHTGPLGRKMALLIPSENVGGWSRYSVMKMAEDGFRESLHQLGYGLEIHRVEEPGSLPRLLNQLYHRGIEGVAISPALSIEVTRPLDWAPFAVVSLLIGQYQHPFHGIRGDFFQMGELACRKALEKGYQRIGYSAGFADKASRMRGPAAVFSHANAYPGAKVDIFPPWHKIPCLTYKEPAEPISREFFEWFDAFRPDVVISISGYIIDLLKKVGIHCPGDYGFILLNLPPGNDQVSGVKGHTFRQGQVAAERLHRLILNNEKGIPEIKTVLRVAGTWVEGETLPELPAKRPNLSGTP